MKNDNIEFHILLRSSEYPVIIIAEDNIYSAFNIKDLVTICLVSEPARNSNRKKVINSSVLEFSYLTGQFALVPGFMHKKWTKNRLKE